MSKTEHKIASTDELANDGDVAIEEVRGQEIAVFRVDGEYHAIANYCVHQGGPLCENRELTGSLTVEDGKWAYEKEGQVVTCPWHAWKFDVVTGKNVSDERYRVPTYDVVVKDGDILVRR